MKKPKAKPDLRELVLAAMRYFVKPSTAESIGNYIEWKDHGRYVGAEIEKTLLALELAGKVERGRARTRWQLRVPRPPSAARAVP